MGRRGPAPIPTSIKLLQGNPGRRPLNKREPKSRSGTPVCPDWLGAKAKARWQQIVPELKEMGILSPSDCGALIVYCDAWERWRLAVTELSTLKYGTDDAAIKRASIIARDLAVMLHRFDLEFGLTPSARTRIQVEKPSGEQDEFERFVSRKGKVG